MYLAHPKTKLKKLVGSKGFIEHWNYNSENLDVERVTNIGGKDTLAATRYDRHIYVLKGIGNVETNESHLLAEGDLVKIPKSKMATIADSQLQYLVIKGQVQTPQKYGKGTKFKESPYKRFVYILDGFGRLNHNSKMFNINPGAAILLEPNETLEIFSGEAEVLIVESV
ncbi:hypothetical protein [Bacillus bombysepticus]|uniref:hypothetical protein n=1 Tax=Bacillus bombysepticus TaxID=658666 RepID=UPI003015D8DE